MQSLRHLVEGIKKIRSTESITFLLIPSSCTADRNILVHGQKMVPSSIQISNS